MNQNKTILLPIIRGYEKIKGYRDHENICNYTCIQIFTCKNQIIPHFNTHRKGKPIKIHVKGCNKGFKEKYGWSSGYKF